MKKSRIISVVLSCALLLSLTMPALATATKPSTIVSGSSSLRLLEPEYQNMIFLNEEPIAVSSLPISYQYTIEQYDIEDESAKVILDLSIQDIDTSYQCVVTGTPNIYEITVGGTKYEYISGPLRGNINIADNNYNIIVGFQKYSGSQEIQGDVTIQDVDYDCEPIFLTFGNIVVSDDIRNAIRDVNDQNMKIQDEISDNPVQHSADYSNPRKYVEGPSKTTQLTSSSDVDAVTVLVHYNEYENRVMGTAIPHIAAMQEKFDFYNFDRASLNALSIEMEERSTSDGDFEGTCYIPNGAGNGTYSVSNTASFFASVLDIVANVSWFSLAASAVDSICEIVESNKTKCTVTDNIDIVGVSYDFGELRNTELDSCGISIIAGMGPFREGMSNPVARFTAKANATYLLRRHAPASGLDILEYYDANEALVYCSMTLT